MKYFFSLVILVSSLLAVQDKILLNEEEKAWIKNHPVVRYSEVNWKPLSIIEEGRMKGIMGDYMDLISKKTGLRFRYIPSRSWPEVLERFQRGEIDVVPGIGSSDAETRLGSVSKTYATYPMVIVTRNNYRFVDSITRFYGKKLAIPKHYTSYNFLRAKYPKIEIIETKNIPEALLYVAASKAEAFVGHIATSLYYMSALQLQKLKVSGRADFMFEHHYLVQDSQPVLLAIIDKAIAAITEEERAKIQARWIKIRVEQRVDYTIVYQALAVFFLIVAFLVYRQRILQAKHREIKQLQERLELSLLGSNEAFFDLELETNALSIASQWREMLHLPPTTVQKYRFDEWLEYVHPNDKEKIVRFVEANKTKIGAFIEVMHRERSVRGEWKWILLRARVYKRQERYHLVGTLSDMTEKKRLEEQIRFHTLILEQVHDSVIMTDLKGFVTFWNQGATKIFGYSAEEMLGKHISILTPKEYLEQTKAGIRKVLTTGQYVDEVYRVRKDGKRIFVSLRLSLVRDENGEPTNIIGFSQDLTEKKLAQEKLKRQQEILYYQAMFDTLTKLPNRVLLKDRLKQAMESSKRKQTQLAVMFIDLDNFKIINDSFGHSIGDEVLKGVAQRLQSALREQDTIARIGGDEFVVVLKDLHISHDAVTIAQKLLDRFREPFVVDHRTFYLTCSIGISMYPIDSSDDEELIKFADTAMYKAKENGKNSFEFYSSEMTASAFERVVMEANIREAIAKEEFIVYYQPQIDIQNGKLRGVEALVRWKHPQMGTVSPGSFIPIAEASGLIVELDRYIMQKALLDIAFWKEEGVVPQKVYLNLSMKQLRQNDFLTFLHTTIQESGCDFRRIGLEVTESEIMKDPQKSIETLRMIRDFGIELAVDDFGTGYSSLAYLKRLPINELKIDRSFIIDIPRNEEDTAIVQTILALAKTLNLKVVAEGVETKEQWHFFKENGCDFVQGYYYARPMDAKEFVRYYTTFENNTIPT